jgi:uncharacterized membrane protein YfcA
VAIDAKAGVFIALSIVGVAFVAFWIVHARATRGGWPKPVQIIIGVVTDFFDTLGIGSFATTTSLFKFGRVVDDANIPGTLNVGHTLPTLAQAFIYIVVVKVDMQTLILMIAAAVAGAWLGAGFVSSWSRRGIQTGMGVLLLVAAMVMITRLQFMPGGGQAEGLHGVRLAIGLGGNFVLGALMTLGIGLYAPCMVLVSLLGMNDAVAFPIMMGSCAFLMPAASVRFVRSGRYDVRAALGLAIGGVPAALVAGLIVKNMKLETVKWIVVFVVIYTAAAMLYSAAKEKRRG